MSYVWGLVMVLFENHKRQSCLLFCFHKLFSSTFEISIMNVSNIFYLLYRKWEDFIRKLGCYAAVVF
jgi:hypothetical protein